MTITADDDIKDRKAHRHLLKAARKLNGHNKHHGDLHHILKHAGAAQMPRQRRGSLLFTLARAIVGQQVAAKVARTFWQRLEQAADQADQPLAQFLQPANAQKIRACGLSNNKVRFLIGLGEAQASGFLSARRINMMDHPARIDYLTQLDGIGVWTCDMVGIFYCRDRDIWPQGDLAVRRTFARLTGTDEKITQEHAQLFAPWRSHLALHMWREKNNPMIT